MSEANSTYHRTSESTAVPPVINESESGSLENLNQISLAPYIQSYLTQNGRRYSCCNVMLPVAFERAAAKSWLDPHFDSPVLEGQYQASIFPQIRLRFKFALIYILACSLLWFVYFAAGYGASYQLITLLLTISLIMLACCVGLYLERTNMFRANTYLIAAVIAIAICAAALCFVAFTGHALSPLGHFALCIEIVLLIYTVIPLPLWLNVAIASIYSILFEVLSYVSQSDYHYNENYQKISLFTPTLATLVVEAVPVDQDSPESTFLNKIVIIRILLQLCVHLMGVHVLLMTVVRMRGTFMKVGQNLLVRRQLEMEKQLKETMIHSMMPPKVADILMKESAGMDYDFRYRNSSNPKDLRSLFRPFHMASMDNVSILFADIVGFTKMSSTKTAEQLVEILSDLFERFDNLCVMNGCEKISTLGDCYYCVSGCPEPRPDSSICCVEMGLGMIQAMRVFDAQRGEGVKMRVGVHTGTVLCGIVGTKRVKFDVWSNDVTLANRMESTGRPEQVHVSEETCNFLGDAYILEEGEEVYGHRTYFVLGKRQDLVNSLNNSKTNLFLSPNDGFMDNVKLSRSVTNISGMTPTVPPSSPLGPISTSLNPSPVLTTRPRIASFSKVSKLLSSKSDSKEQRDNGCKKLSNASITACPKIVINVNDDEEEVATAKAAHNEHDLEGGDTKILNDCLDDSLQHSKSSTLAGKLINWKITNFLLKKADHGPADHHTIVCSNTLDSSCSSNEHNNDCDIPSNTKQQQSEDVPFLDQNGYQQLPIVIESEVAAPTTTAASTTATTSSRPSCHMLELPNPHMGLHRTSSAKYSGGHHHQGHGHETAASLLSQSTMFDDVIDIRSYISQSRSDISPFNRSGSYRSQSGRGGGGSSGHHNQVPAAELSPTTGRPRSSTLHSPSVDYTGRERSCNLLGLNPCNPEMSGVGDGISLCLSATSRKDSGIRSNSRRSSIQHQINALNNHNHLHHAQPHPTFAQQHRVSGYFTSSQSSLTGIPLSPTILPGPPHFDKTSGSDFYHKRLHHVPQVDPLAACLQQLRKQSDLQLIRCVRDNAKSQRSYLVKPPISPWTLCFRSRQLEREFRSKAHRFGNENEHEAPPTLATPKYNTYIDIIISVLVYLAIAASLFLLLSPITDSFAHQVWIGLFIVFTFVQFTALFLCTKEICRHKLHPSLSEIAAAARRRPFFRGISNWYPWNFCGAVLLSLPVISILVNFALMDVNIFHNFEFHFGFLLFVCILHFCNFTQLNFWMRNALAFATAIGFVVIAVGHLYALHYGGGSTETSINFSNVNNSTDAVNSTLLELFLNSTRKSEPLAEIDWFKNYRIEIYLDLAILLILVWFLNREFEIGYRLSFYGSAVANQDKIRVQNMKNQADMLLHNIIPKHVAEQLKITEKYSENHHDVAIIFASIVNFNELYDESYLGGKEYLRVLNELIADFDELLMEPRFRCVEKIKTIGSTYMAAAGLDPSSRGEDNEHLYTLLDFAVAMESVVESFNRDLLEFNLILRVGYNIGDVTAGVIGTTKLYYDIWGDAVNIAARMDSTGVAGRVQVSEFCLPYLEPKYQFESRGQVYVKGKDNMEVYLLKEEQANNGQEND